jgi:hypothetical protein
LNMGALASRSGTMMKRTWVLVASAGGSHAAMAGMWLGEARIEMRTWGLGVRRGQ